MARFGTKHTEQVAEPVPTTETIVAPATVAPGITLSEADQAKFDAMKTKSERIRFLASFGHKNGPISKYLTSVYSKLVRYQHVRNVLKTQLKKSS